MKISKDASYAIIEKINCLYGDQAQTTIEALQSILDEFSLSDFAPKAPLTQKTAYLITYGDAIQETGKSPLTALHDLLKAKIKGSISDVHLLPMFPYTSDDGFSVTDYEVINPEYGDWSHIESLSQDYRLMFDFVANHMSRSSQWFQNYLNDVPGFEDAFVTYDENFDSSKTTRPRTSPLFHEYVGEKGITKRAWSTFSEDQVDVNIQDPAMFARLTKVLLDYAAKGAASIRLDAIGFLWKESGTTSMHLEQTHEIIKIWRLLLDEIAPHTQIITETNVPHAENISYFGQNDEANQVYQFPLPPLTLHAFTVGNAEKLSEWAKKIDHVGENETYFNFLASHDGIGMRPTEGILTEEERETLVAKVKMQGGRISYKSNPDGTQTVYEMNINYSDALRNAGEDDATAVQKMKAAHSILLSVLGVPAIYYHSLFGSRNDYVGLESSGINRRINREKLDGPTLAEELLHNPYRKGIFNGLIEMLDVRSTQTAFNPYGTQEILDLDARIFAVKRHNSKTGATVLSLTNVSDQAVTLMNIQGTNLLTGEKTTGTLHLPAYAYAWIK
ncbi:sugar phosphorylase [Lactococcus garvieae]|uniref:sugar phosphorylase n=1 Tax=Lactococcus garvieae TaxID=1363 RepID=UPI0018D8ECBD|nr:sugar phosphorylase [Lactococcus garvieae]QPS71639.1 sugar phosphorylase [Lactococcus garvieae]